MKKLLEIIPWFIITIPLFVVIRIEKIYHRMIEYRFVWFDIAELLLSSFVIFGISFLFTRNLVRASVNALPVMLIFYFFADLKDTLNKWNNTILLTSYTFLLPATIILLLLAFWLIRKSRSDFRKLMLFVNTLFIVFILYDITSLVFKNASGKSQTSTIVSDTVSVCDTCTRPDIYYLVFDAYTSSRVLQLQFGFENSQLDSFLIRNQFYVIPNSTSNYNLTPFSIASTLNSDYLSSINTRKDFYLDEYLPGIELVYDNRLVPILVKQGYQIINHSIFSFRHFPSTIRIFDLWELHLVYDRHNLIKKIDRDIGWILWPRFRFAGNVVANHKKYAAQRDAYFENTVSDLLETIKGQTNQPKFTYAHMLLPHGPYTYDSMGNKIPYSYKPRSENDYKKEYVSQLKHANTVITTTIQSILSHSKKPCVIILQGDHGYKYMDPTKAHLEFANLNAIYFYNKDYRMLHDSLSNVNTFRVIFNTFFGKNYPLLKDTSYFLQYR